MTVGLDHEAAELRLRISDNGAGFDQAKAKTSGGLGLARRKTQIGRIAGSLTIWSQRAWGNVDRSSESAVQPAQESS